MKAETRDNIIYVSFGLAVVALVAFDAFYADSHGREMWWPTNFEFNFVGYLLLMEYFVVTETRKVGAALQQRSLFAILAGALHVTILFLFPKPFSAGAYVSLPAGFLEIVVITRAMIWIARRLTPNREIVRGWGGTGRSR